ncbi:MAG: hypothetical protein ACLFPE_11735 [Bacteroidales bacterium]
MQNPLADISCITGLIIIFILAGIYQANFSWMGGIAILLGILIITNWMGELSRRNTIRLAVFSWICTIATSIYIIINYS